ncbi:hypothetical protein JRQ81_000516, partial [Phrynocephalus forsythii]
IDECAAKMHYCHANTVCVNLPGSYRCDCVSGYIRIDDFSCTERDECDSGQHNCDENAICTNTVRGHSCTCKPGYVGNGTICRGAFHPKKIDRARKCVNKELGNFVHKEDGSVITHHTIRFGWPDLYPAGGMHLLELGLELYLSDLYGGLCIKLLSWEGEVAYEVAPLTVAVRASG